MEDQIRRPIVIWLVLLYLCLLLLGNLLVTVRLTSYFFNSGSEGAINLLASVGFAALITLAIIGIAKKAVWGRRFAVLCFVLLGVVNFFRLLTLINWPDKNADLTNAVRLVLAQLVLSFVFVIAFGFSETIRKYFKLHSDPTSPLPPPPSFDT